MFGMRSIRSQAGPARGRGGPRRERHLRVLQPLRQRAHPARADGQARPLHRVATSPTTASTACSPRTSRCSPSSSKGPWARGPTEDSDVVGAMIRDAKGAILAQKGASIKNLPATPRPSELTEILNAETTAGEPIILFRAPVTTASSGAATWPRSWASPPRAAEAKKEDQKGGVEVAISKSLMNQQQRSRFLQTTLLSFALVALGAVGGWYLIGRWFAARAAHGRGELRGGQGRPHREPSRSTPTTRSGCSAKSLNEMVQNLRRIVDNIQEASVQVATSAGQISANARLITQGASEPGPGRRGDLHLHGGDGGLHPDRGRQLPEPRHLRGGDLVLHHRDGRLHRAGGQVARAAWPRP